MQWYCHWYCSLPALMLPLLLHLCSSPPHLVLPTSLLHWLTSTREYNKSAGGLLWPLTTWWPLYHKVPWHWVSRGGQCEVGKWHRRPFPQEGVHTILATETCTDIVIPFFPLSLIHFRSLPVKKWMYCSPEETSMTDPPQDVAQTLVVHLH